MTGSQQRRAWTAVLFALAMIDGIALQARGALFVSFQDTFGVTEAQLALVTPAGTVGFVICVIAMGILAGRIQMRRWLLVGVGGTVVGFLAIGMAPTFLVLLGMIGLRSASTGIFRGLDRPLMSHLYPSQRGRMFNLHTMVWAIGATIGPLLVTAVIFLGNWRYIYGILAVCMTLVLLVMWRLHVPASIQNEKSFTMAAFKTAIQQRELRVMAVALVLVGGLESVFFTWLPFYGAQFFRPELANIALSVYLAAYIPGRYIYSRLTQRAPYLTIVLASVAVILVMLPITFSLAGHLAMFPSLFVVGMLISGLFPTLLAWGVDITPEYTGPINAAALGAGQIGFLVFPATVGVLAELFSIEQAIFLQVGLVAILLVVLVLARRYLR